MFALHEKGGSECVVQGWNGCKALPLEGKHQGSRFAKTSGEIPCALR